MSSQQRKRTILVITHLYPRFEGCTMAPFLGIWAENLAKQYNMIILVPRHEKALPERNGVKLVYFGYFFKSLEKFSYTSSLFAKVRKFNILYQLLAIFYFISYTYKCLIIARIPISMKTDPNNVYKKNLIAAYSRLGPPQTPIRKYIGTNMISQNK